jgi:hypothetical protein
MDFLATLAGLRPWRCHTCERRFRARRVALFFSRYAHCPKCGNFDLQNVSHKRVEKGTFVFLKKRLKFPAYRCDPCRETFFSVRPFHRILPSMSIGVRGKASRAASQVTHSPAQN